MAAIAISRLLDRYRVMGAKGFKLADFDPDDTGGKLVERPAAEALLAANIARLAALQEKLYAQGQWALLAVFQGMDGSGKDGTIKHVLSGVNPQGVQAVSFKAPSEEELAHDFLWRVARAVPERGRIGVFNRSHYEEVLAVRVHPEFLARQRIPPDLVGKKIWDERFVAIADFERRIAREGWIVLKFFLHISKGEQRRRFLARLDEKDKNWKFSASDLAERAYWSQYQDAYAAAIAATAAPHAPWFVVPADHKWFAHLVVSAAMVEALDRLDLTPPPLSKERRDALAAARAKLAKEG